MLLLSQDLRVEYRYANLVMLKKTKFLPCFCGVVISEPCGCIAGSPPQLEIHITLFKFNRHSIKISIVAESYANLNMHLVPKEVCLDTQYNGSDATLTRGE